MMEDTLITLIQTTGFPIVVSLWFMFKMDRVIKANTNALENLSQIIKNNRGK